ncbi:kinase-like domain-containing protein [Absidia repens]|uniref:non-specific serine/threonine protein kinase n=1 Tax=Absidia repens TaxID=90262 RepID=A0A1X2INB0_9FUNG|nr:kinase-like domain-containing protein [Absidia repens]
MDNNDENAFPPTTISNDDPPHGIYHHATQSDKDASTTQMISFRLPDDKTSVSFTPPLPPPPPSIPPPLPYLPSDYRPSPTSLKHIVLSPNFADSQLPASATSTTTTTTTSTSARQRSRSVGNLIGDITGNDNTSSSYTDHYHRPYTVLNGDDGSQLKQHFELVPYREWTVILRNEDSGNAVLYNQENQQVSVQRYIPMEAHSTLPPSTETEGVSECPLCHRPYSKNDQTLNSQPTYMDRNYFRLLRSSPMGTPKTSTDNTPRSTNGLEKPLDDLFDESTSTLHLNANAINQGYYSNFFIELRKLGRGFRGSVYLCEHILDGVKLGKYAVKKVAIGNNHTWLVKMLREVHLLERLHHPNIVSYKHSWLEYDRLTPFGPKVPCLFILMECANGGNLEEYLEPEISSEHHQQPGEKKKSPKELKRERIKRQLQQQDEYEAEVQNKQPIQTQKRLLGMAEISSLFLDIVQGLDHLHQQHIVHRDLKLANLLLKWDDRRRGSEVFKIPRVLISDFGECEDLEGVPDSDRTGATGTMEFMAPEHVRLDPHGRNTVEYSPKADMWSLGMVLYYLCYSRLPYSNVDDVDTLRKEILAFKEITFPKSRFDIFKDTTAPNVAAMMENMKRQHATDIPNEFKMLIRLLLSKDPSKRPSCQEILSKLGQVQFDSHQDLSSNDWVADGEPTTSSPTSTPRFDASTSAAVAAAASSFSPANGVMPSNALLVGRRRRPSSSPPWSIQPSTPTTQDVTSIEPTADTELTSVMELDEQIKTVALDDMEEEDDNTTDMDFDFTHSDLSTPVRTTSKRSNLQTTELESHYIRTDHHSNVLEPNSSTHGMRKRQKRTNDHSYPDSASDDDERHSPLLLLDTPSSYSLLMQDEKFYLHILKTITAVFKVATCTYPCLPYSTKPLIFYPVILLATVDFWSEKISHSLLLLSIHLIWLISMALLTGGMCMSVY